MNIISEDMNKIDMPSTDKSIIILCKEYVIDNNYTNLILSIYNKIGEFSIVTDNKDLFNFLDERNFNCEYKEGVELIEYYVSNNKKIKYTIFDMNSLNRFTNCSMLLLSYQNSVVCFNGKSVVKLSTDFYKDLQEFVNTYSNEFYSFDITKDKFINNEGDIVKENEHNIWRTTDTLTVIDKFHFKYEIDFLEENENESCLIVLNNPNRGIIRILNPEVLRDYSSDTLSGNYYYVQKYNKGAININSKYDISKIEVIKLDNLDKTYCLLNKISETDSNNVISILNSLNVHNTRNLIFKLNNKFLVFNDSLILSNYLDNLGNKNVEIVVYEYIDISWVRSFDLNNSVFKIMELTSRDKDELIKEYYTKPFIPLVSITDKSNNRNISILELEVLLTII